MAKHRAKKRTQPRAPTHNGSQNGSGKRPRSMVIRIGAGEVGTSVSQLAKDVRRMMEPDTASRLKARHERKSNKLRDYTTMTGPLGVTHLLLFSRSSSGNVNFRLALTPRGPTLNFRVDSYSLSKDVVKAVKDARAGSAEHLSPPLLVMNNFSHQAAADGTAASVPRHLESLSTTIFQSLFPPINPQSVSLKSIRRVMLLDREAASKDEGSYVLNLRHYAIVTKRTGLSRSIRKLSTAEKPKDGKRGRHLPNLGQLGDVSDYLLHASAGGFTSGSDSEVETDAEVEVAENEATKVKSRRELMLERQSGSETPHRRKLSVQKRAVKLVELGPRMRLRLIKVEEGVCAGRVMWHEFVKKTGDEIEAMDLKWKVRRAEKEERKRIQKENVAKKKAGKNGRVEGDADDGEEISEDDEDAEDWTGDEMEVGDATENT